MRRAPRARASALPASVFPIREADYLPDRGLATALFLALSLEKPVLLEGEASGMRAALPYVDRFLPGHNLESLEALGSVLSGIDRRHAA